MAGRVSSYAPSARLVWGAAVAAYGVAVLHRSSLGVAGVQALDRFDVGAAVLSTFALMSLSVIAVVISGPVIGVLTGRHPLRRSWTAVLVHPGRSPLWLLAVLVIVLGVGGPGSAIGFDYARTFNPADRLGTASGLVNMGGFSTAVVTMLAVGIVLDVAGAGAPLSLPAFRLACAVMAVPWSVAVVGVLVSRRSTRRAMFADGVLVPPIRQVLAQRRDGRATAADSADGAEE